MGIVEAAFSIQAQGVNVAVWSVAVKGSALLQGGAGQVTKFEIFIYFIFNVLCQAGFNEDYKFINAKKYLFVR